MVPKIIFMGTHIEDTTFDPFQDEKQVAKLLSVRFGMTMKHAGVAITITSVTDLLAFAIGKSNFWLRTN